MKVKCINAGIYGQLGQLTEGKIYDVVEVTGSYYRVRDNNGEVIGRCKRRFEVIEEKSLEEQFKEACKFIGKTVRFMDSSTKYKVDDVRVLYKKTPHLYVSMSCELWLDKHDFCVALISGSSSFPYQDAKLYECIEYVLNKDYTAQIYKDKVVVGRQTFDLATVKEVVKKAESLN